MAIFIRTDMPIPPGTASASSTTVFSGTSYSSGTLYYTTFSIGPVSEATLASLSITLSKKSIVAIVASSFMTLSANEVLRHRIYVGNTKVYESAYDPNSIGQLRVHVTYVVLPPGTYEISYRLYNSDTVTRYAYVMAHGSALPALVLLAFVIPLE
jgi:hypothetical protein